MRLSEERIKCLRTLLREHCDLELTDEQAQEAGMAILRFVLAKAQRKRELAKYKENDYGQPNSTKAA